MYKSEIEFFLIKKKIKSKIEINILKKFLPDVVFFKKKILIKVIIKSCKKIIFLFYSTLSC